MLAIVSVAALYIAGVIGAGFASGQEIVQFFVKFGFMGLIGAALSVTIMTLGTGYILDWCIEKRVGSYKDVLSVISGPVSGATDAIYTIFLIASVSIMLAGAGEIFAGFGMKTIALYFTALLVGLVLIRGVEQILNTSVVLIPILIIVFITVCVRYLLVNGFHLPTDGGIAGVGAGVLYASYNLSYALAVLAGVHQLLESKAQGWRMALLGNLTLALILFLLILTLGSLPQTEQASALPMLYVAQDWSSHVFFIYIVILWASMYTTALANSFALVKRVTAQTSLSWLSSTVLVIGIAVLFSHFGFVVLIRVAYPLLGFAGIYLFYALLRTRI